MLGVPQCRTSLLEGQAVTGGPFLSLLGRTVKGAQSLTQNLRSLPCTHAKRSQQATDMSTGGTRSPEAWYVHFPDAEHAS